MNQAGRKEIQIFFNKNKDVLNKLGREIFEMSSNIISFNAIIMLSAALYSSCYGENRDGAMAGAIFMAGAEKIERMINDGFFLDDNKLND